MAIQFLCLGALAWPLSSGRRTMGALAVPGTILRIAGLAVVVVASLALGRSLTPSPVPNAAGVVVTSGMYRLVRHPIYSGLLLFAAGSALEQPHPVRLAAAAGLAVLLSVKARWEERMLRETLPGYDAYAEQVGRFVPRLRRRR